jgi:hypothetical protein
MRQLFESIRTVIKEDEFGNTPTYSNNVVTTTNDKKKQLSVPAGRGRLSNTTGNTVSGVARSGPASSSSTSFIDSIKKLVSGGGNTNKPEVNPTAKMTGDTSGNSNDKPVVSAPVKTSASPTSTSVSAEKNFPGKQKDDLSLPNKKIPLPKSKPTTNTTSNKDKNLPKFKPVSNVGAGSNKTSAPVAARSTVSVAKTGPAFSMDNYRNAVASGSNKKTALRAGAGIKEEKEELMEKSHAEKLFKKMVRGMKGWGFDGPLGKTEPKEMIKRHKEYSDEELKTLKNKNNKLSKGSPADFQQKIINREMRKRKMDEQNIFSEKELTYFDSIMSRDEHLSEAKRGRPSKSDFEASWHPDQYLVCLCL